MNKEANYFKIYNKSSENMSEVLDGTIDFILTSPPYNIGTQYGEFSDTSDFESYKERLSKIIGECYRVQGANGIFIVEVADSIKIGDRYIQLAGLFQNLSLKHGYYLIGRDIDFIETENHKELPGHGFENDYSTTKNEHSNCHQILIFSKEEIPFAEGSIHYINYNEFFGDHPCPTPKEALDLLLPKYYKAGQTALDPFMGTANLGVEVLKQGGNFFGYEIDESFYEKANTKLEEQNQ